MYSFVNIFIANIISDKFHVFFFPTINIFGISIGVLMLYTLIFKRFNIFYNYKQIIFLVSIVFFVFFASLTSHFIFDNYHINFNKVFFPSWLFIVQVAYAMHIYNSKISLKSSVKIVRFFANIALLEFYTFLIISKISGNNYGYNSDSIYEGFIFTFELTAFLFVFLTIVHLTSYFLNGKIENIAYMFASSVPLLLMTRSYLLTLIVSVFLVYVFYRKLAPVKPIKNTLLLLLGGALASVIIMQQLSNRGIDIDKSETLMIRVFYLDIYSQLLFINPFGTGISSAKDVIQNLKPDNAHIASYIFPDYQRHIDRRLSSIQSIGLNSRSHNSFVNWIVELGLAGIVYLIIFASILIKHYRKNSSSIFFSTLVLALLSSLFSSLFLDLEGIRIFWFVIAALLLKEIKNTKYKEEYGAK